MRIRNIWRQYAFLARYGHQPIPVLRTLTQRELRMLQEELSYWVSREPALSFGAGGGG